MSETDVTLDDVGAGVPTGDEWESAQYLPSHAVASAFGDGDPKKKKAPTPLHRVPTGEEWEKAQRLPADAVKGLTLPLLPPPPKAPTDAIKNPLAAGTKGKKLAPFDISDPTTYANPVLRQIVNPALDNPMTTAAIGLAPFAAAGVSTGLGAAVGAAMAGTMVHSIASYGWQKAAEMQLSPEDRARAEADPDRVSGESAAVQAAMLGLAPFIHLGIKSVRGPAFGEGMLEAGAKGVHETLADPEVAPERTAPFQGELNDLHARSLASGADERIPQDAAHPDGFETTATGARLTTKPRAVAGLVAPESVTPGKVKPLATEAPSAPAEQHAAEANALTASVKDYEAQRAAQDAAEIANADPIADLEKRLTESRTRSASAVDKALTIRRRPQGKVPYFESEQGAELLGAAAARHGLPEDASPYHPDSPLDAVWKQGHESATQSYPEGLEHGSAVGEDTGPAKGMVRLYRAQLPDTKLGRDPRNAIHNAYTDSPYEPAVRGRWFTDNEANFRSYANLPGREVVYVDVPKRIADGFNLANLPKHLQDLGSPGMGEYIVPDEWLSKATPLRATSRPSHSDGFSIGRGLTDNAIHTEPYAPGSYHRGPVKEITRITPDELVPQDEWEVAGAKRDMERAGKTPEEWARSVDLTTPIDATIYNSGRIKLDDGHHRHLAATILGKPLNVNLRAMNATGEVLNEAIQRISSKLREGTPQYPDGFSMGGALTDNRIPGAVELPKTARGSDVPVPEGATPESVALANALKPSRYRTHTTDELAGAALDAQAELERAQAAVTASQTREHRLWEDPEKTPESIFYEDRGVHATDEPSAASEKALAQAKTRLAQIEREFAMRGVSGDGLAEVMQAAKEQRMERDGMQSDETLNAHMGADDPFGENAPSSSGLRPMAGTGETVTRGVSASIERRAIANKLATSLGDLPGFQRMDFAEQAKGASELLASDPARALRIAKGEELPPAHLLPESVAVAVENKAITDGDVATLRELATGKLASDATEMGRRIAAYRMRDPESPVAAIQSVVDAREAGAKNTPQMAEREAKKILGEIKKLHPTTEKLAAFLDSLRC